MSARPLAAPPLDDEENPLLRPWPHSIDAEEHVLSMCLLNNETYHRVAPLVAADDFYVGEHVALYVEIGRLVAAGQQANSVTLAHIANSHEAMRGRGGVGFLARLLTRHLGAHGVEDSARIVADMAQKRRLIDAHNAAVERLFDMTSPETSIELGAQGRKAIDDVMSRAPEHGSPEAAAAFDRLAEWVEAAHRGEAVRGKVLTGLRAIDGVLGGMDPGELIVLGGRPSMGKTALGLHLALQAAIQAQEWNEAGGEPWRVGFFSYEMTQLQLIARVLAPRLKIPFNRLLGKAQPPLSRDEMVAFVRARAAIAELPLLLDDKVKGTVHDLRARAVGLNARGRLGLIVVDHLGWIRPSRDAARLNKVDQVGEVSSGLKALAKELGCPVLALCQLNRAVESESDQRPQMRHLRNSGDIEQDCDVIGLIYREAYYLGRKPNLSSEEAMRLHTIKHDVELIWPKVRDSEVGTSRARVELGINAWRDTTNPADPPAWATDAEGLA